MQQSTASPRTASLTIDDIISVFRISTQHQYNARELDTPVCSTVFWLDSCSDFPLERNDRIECHQSVWSRLRLSGFSSSTLSFGEGFIACFRIVGVQYQWRTFSVLSTPSSYPDQRQVVQRIYAKNVGLASVRYVSSLISLDIPTSRFAISLFDLVSLDVVRVSSHLPF